MKKIALAAMLAIAASARADGVPLLIPVTYAPGAPVEPKVRDVCKPDERLGADVGDALAGTTASNAGAVVKVSIAGVTGGDASWSGPKGISIHVDLMKDGQVERSTDLTRTTDGGVYGEYKHVCTLLDNDSGRLAKAVAEWVAKGSNDTGKTTRK